MNDTQSKIGKLLEPGEQRDAIHVAVLLVIAGHELGPGEHVGLVPATTALMAMPGGVITAISTRAGLPAERLIGIVDPFLPEPVKHGDRFFLFLYPNTVTDMRHHWAHPALETLPAVNKAVSVKWINEYAQEIDEDPEVLIQAGKDYIQSGEYLSDGGKYEGVCLKNEFWDHFEVITGIKVQVPARQSFFTCSC